MATGTAQRSIFTINGQELPVEVSEQSAKSTQVVLSTKRTDHSYLQAAKSGMEHFWQQRKITCDEIGAHNGRIVSTVHAPMRTIMDALQPLERYLSAQLGAFRPETNVKTMGAGAGIGSKGGGSSGGIMEEGGSVGDILE
jgi:hypothetical protein